MYPVKDYIHLIHVRIYSEMNWRNYQYAKQLSSMSPDQPRNID